MSSDMVEALPESQTRQWSGLSNPDGPGRVADHPERVGLGWVQVFYLSFCCSNKQKVWKSRPNLAASLNNFARVSGMIWGINKAWHGAECCIFIIFSISLIETSD